MNKEARVCTQAIVYLRCMYFLLALYIWYQQVTNLEKAGFLYDVFSREVCCTTSTYRKLDWFQYHVQYLQVADYA